MNKAWVAEAVHGSLHLIFSCRLGLVCENSQTNSTVLAEIPLKIGLGATPKIQLFAKQTRNSNHSVALRQTDAKKLAEFF